MIKGYRQRIIRTLDAIEGVGNIRDIKAGLADKEILNKLEEKGYLSYSAFTPRGERFHRRLHEKQMFGGPEGKRKYSESFNYWAEKVRPLAEASENSQRNIDLGLIVMSH